MYLRYVDILKYATKGERPAPLIKINMKRCDTCDSTEMEDTIFNLGIENTPLTSWVVVENPDGTTVDRCNRCMESINEALGEFEDPEENEEKEADE